MACYGKAIRKVKNGERYEFTDDRIRVCQKCDDNFWIRRNLFCLLQLRRFGRTLWADPNAFIPALAAKEKNECLKGEW